MAKKKKKEVVENKSLLQEKIQNLRDFFEESKGELKKVTWPTKKETLTTSAAVLLLVLVVSLYLGLVDLALAKIIEALLS
ncbi:preprotein translocase subunit SecE [Desulfohalobiaceae bacterium Ax17]|uniref:preprotein translocase subunit SecE n=1 Tax=Desulfovulcanus ferrireducens TaxID=2831190 RepID=UPI00207BCA1B|nr:preprotein translocase subunit SecE [Desulfovulcanus ferrireducens]MBT8762869.1 preprotein translocase subunit SecE [Desulfovulcanus ferrireducens]